jgi:hypothetical protein
MPPVTTPFSATAFIQGVSPCPSTITAANSALAVALETAKDEAAAAEERVRVAALAWEHERATSDALARQVTEAERFLHASTGEHVTSSQQSPSTAPLLGAGHPGGTDDPMVAYLHLQAAGSRTSRLWSPSYSTPTPPPTLDGGTSFSSFFAATL